LVFADKGKLIENKTEHEFNVINSFESALIEHHGLTHNDLLQHSGILNEMAPQQQQPVIVRPPSTKLSRILMEDDGKCILISIIFFIDIILLKQNCRR